MSGTAISPLRTALRCRCPRCGEGRVLRGLLDVCERCEVCGLDLSAADTGDGPAVLVILLLGFIVVALAAVVEIRFSPPLWVHLMLWTPFTIGGAIVMLRPLKAWLIAQQYRYRRFGASPPQV
ncbi:MAG TPA: DUF983 domain-containing protein [Acetobacteraceae bacterium]|nr:DUF983 domain-containing protein [Acetobacteraceae bacterium]